MLLQAVMLLRMRRKAITAMQTAVMVAAIMLAITIATTTATVTHQAQGAGYASFAFGDHSRPFRHHCPIIFYAASSPLHNDVDDERGTSPATAT